MESVTPRATSLGDEMNVILLTRIACISLRLDQRTLYGVYLSNVDRALLATYDYATSNILLNGAR